jgi:ABC-type Fe3+-siderophore transport system permease subunit
MVMDDSQKSEITPQQLPPVRIRRGVILQMTIYEVAEDELETLAHGSPDSVYLNFAIFLLSIATAFLISLLTTEVSNRTFAVFVILIAVGYVLGAFFSILWYKNRKSISALVQRIQERLPQEGIQEVWTVTDDSEKGKK